jgi:competence protein ComEC
VARVAAGWRVEIGRIQATTLGPQRRYAADNDGALVTWLDAGGPTALLTADIEAVAQNELPPLRPDLLQVPHHGSATTDLGWMIAVEPILAVVSVGPNSYGHPNADLMTGLRDAGVAVLTTWRSGDITVPLWE